MMMTQKQSALRTLAASEHLGLCFAPCVKEFLCSSSCVYSSHNNLKAPLRKTTELAKGKEHPFEGPHSKQHFSSLHGLPTEQGWFLNLLHMLFFTPWEC